MARVDPFVIQWPQAWIDDPQIEPVIKYLNRFLHDLWKRTGGGDDYIESNQNDTTYETGGTAQALDEIGYLEQIEDLIPSYTPTVFYTAVKIDNYTAVHGDFIEAQNGVIITLDPEAEQDDEIIIANGDGTNITVLGSIKYTDLDTELIIRNQGTSIHLQRFSDYWRIR